MARLVRPSLQIIDFLGGLRLEGRDWSRDFFLREWLGSWSFLAWALAATHVREDVGG